MRTIKLATSHGLTATPVQEPVLPMFDLLFAQAGKPQDQHRTIKIVRIDRFAVTG